MWKLNQFLSCDDEEREESFLEEESDGLCSLSPTQRMYAFAASLVAGLALMFLSLIVFAKPIKFALLFTFGNMLAVGRLFGTPCWTLPAYSVVCYCVFGTFLIGTERQLGMMFDPARIYATAIYIGCVVLALICALLIHSKILTVFAIIFEICALIWYSLSYIPFARRMVSNLMIRLCDTEL
ncbi:PREDICTED: vesicle transport protein SFT2B-like isoform X1 [Populus euphratica]|uniref:Vesicle transport protein n=2 Tax=Populus euphratica TaxID=75702 RepID=A0AAJ6TJS1_POPEU|nr:PREDICTED: vesicle transport protein SFT2B-like isoform X1 [Populus euphratica]